MRILFYYCCHEYPNNELFLGTAHLYLKTFIDTNYPDLAAQLTWLVPIQEKLSDDDFLKHYNETQPDIVCTSHYIWNHSFLLDQLPRLKKHFDPAVKLIAGGPNIDCHLDEKFFEKYSYIDYAIYGSGEQAFADVVNSLVTKNTLYAIQTVNVAWYNHKTQKQIVAPYRFQTELPVSPYVSNKDLLLMSVEQQRNKGYNVSLSYSQTRGCPYSCSFCDWNSGFSNKVSRRKTSFEDDIDLFQELGITEIFLADSNVGQYNDDVKMIQYFAKKNLEQKANFHIRGNYSKLKKDNNLKIFKELASSGLIKTSFNISVQDTNDTILHNINRPDVGWEVHTSMINNLIEEFPHMYATVQLIQGLPGQTPDSWKETLDKVTSEKTLPMIFVSETLPASPAMLDPEYQKKFNFTYSASHRFDGSKFFYGKFAESCYSFTKKDFVTMTLMSSMYSALSVIKLFCYNDKHIQIDIKNIVDQFLTSNYFYALEKNLYSNWIEQDKFYYTMNFDSSDQIISACIPSETANKWLFNNEFLKFVVTHTAPAQRLNIIKIVKQYLHSEKFTIMLKEYS